MDVYPLRRCSQQMIDTLIGSVNLFRQIQQKSPEQFELLMQYSQIIEAKPEEVLIEEGQIDTWLYFLIKGQLAVFAGESNMTRVNGLTPGEMFGDMAVLMHQPRSATVVVDTGCKLGMILRTDFSIFGEPEEVQNVFLETKLLFYRSMVHNLRWKLETYRVDYPSLKDLVQLNKVQLFMGKKDTMDELLSLDCQAQQLSEMLEQWNQTLISDDRLAGS